MSATQTTLETIHLRGANGGAFIVHDVPVGEMEEWGQKVLGDVAAEIGEALRRAVFGKWTYAEYRVEDGHLVPMAGPDFDARNDPARMKA